MYECFCTKPDRHGESVSKILCVPLYVTFLLEFHMLVQKTSTIAWRRMQANISRIEIQYCQQVSGHQREGREGVLTPLLLCVLQQKK